MTDLRRWALLGCSAFFFAASLASCGPSSSGTGPAVVTPSGTATPSAQPSATPQAPATAPASADLMASAAPTSKPFDPCDKSNPVPYPFEGILASARCEQEMYLEMAGIAGQLGVECVHCHKPHPTKAKEEDYPPMTPKKEIANWMHEHLMKAVKPVDGSPIKCRSCHTDDKGKPIAKIFGSPRDIMKAQEWMSLVMVNKFVTQSGEKLKCKSCHVGNLLTPQFQAKVILRTAQIPAH